MNDVSEDPFARFFSSAARLWRASPWDVLTSGVPVCVDAPDLDVLSGAIFLTQDGDGARAFWMAESLQDCAELLDASLDGEPERADLMEPVRMLSFEPIESMPQEARKEIETMDLDLADPQAFPVLVVITETGEPRVAEPEDIVISIACIEAVCDMMEAKRKQVASSEHVEHASSVTLMGETVRVVLTMPHPDLEAERQYEGEETFLSGFYDAEQGPDPKKWMAMEEDDQHMAIEHYHRETRPHPPAPNRRLHSIMHALAETQVATNQPPEARKALDRLMKQGLSRHDAIHAIATPMAHYLFEASQGIEYDPETHRVALSELTADSWREMVEQDAGAVTPACGPRKPATKKKQSVKKASAKKKPASKKQSAKKASAKKKPPVKKRSAKKASSKKKASKKKPRKS